VWQSAFAFVGKASGSLDIGSQARGIERLAILNAVKNPSFKEEPLLTFKMTKLTGRLQRCARATKNRILQVPQ